MVLDLLIPYHARQCYSFRAELVRTRRRHRAKDITWDRRSQILHSCI